jgi:hypothetical protein
LAGRSAAFAETAAVASNINVADPKYLLIEFMTYPLFKISYRNARERFATRLDVHQLAGGLGARLQVRFGVC